MRSPTQICLLVLATLASQALGQAATTSALPTSAVSATSATSASSAASSVSIPVTAAAGGVTITQPVQTADASFYKLASGVNVTFGWSFTSVLSSPTSLTVRAYCTSNSNTYPIATLPGTATEVVWQPYAYQQTAAASNQPALVQENYRLQIMDDRGLSVGASPGLMSPNEKVMFALYIPQSYTPLSDGWVCASCKSAGSAIAANPATVAVVATMMAVGLSGWSILDRVAASL